MHHTSWLEVQRAAAAVAAATITTTTAVSGSAGAGMDGTGLRDLEPVPRLTLAPGLRRSACGALR